MSERVQRTIARYGRAVRVGFKAISAERGAVLDQYESKTAQRRLLSLLGPLALVAVVASWLVIRVLGDSSIFATLATWLCAMIMPVGIWIIAEYRVRGSAGAPVLPPSAGIIICPECGATQALLARGTTSSCGSCGAVLLPSDALVTRGKDAIDEILLLERMNRWRGERVEWNVRRARTDAQVVDDHRISRPRVALIFLAGGGTLFVMKTLIWAMKSRTMGGTILSAAILGGGVLFVVEWFFDTMSMAPRWARAARLLRAELGAGRQSALGWLNSVWAGPVPASINEFGRHHQVLMTRVHDYPVMLYANTSNITLLLAAWTPGVSDAPDGHPFSSRWRDEPGADVIASELAASDFDVIVTPAGLIGFVRANSLRDFRKSPDLLASLAPTIRRIADLAVAIRAQRVDEVLFGTPGSGAQSAVDSSSEESAS